MSFSLVPTFRAGRLTELTPELLAGHGIRLLMLDFDNTIVPYTTDVPTLEMSGWIEAMKQSDICLAVVSNSRKERVPRFCREHEIPGFLHARKPSTKGILRCLEHFGIPAGQAAIVGDQIYTDTLGGNLAGVSTILVDAIDNHSFWLKARHVLELPFSAAAVRRKL